MEFCELFHQIIQPKEFVGIAEFIANQTELRVVLKTPQPVVAVWSADRRALLALFPQNVWFV